MYYKKLITTGNERKKLAILLLLTNVSNVQHEFRER